MKIIIWATSSPAQKTKALARPAISNSSHVVQTVTDIVEEVKKRGDKALQNFTLKFDSTRRTNFRVSAHDIKAALLQITPQLHSAIKHAKANIEIFHRAEYPQTLKTQTVPGVTCSLHWRPIQKIGLYIPAGTAPLFSALLMQAIPARIAGCTNIILCSPPQPDGKIHPAVLATAALCGIKNVFAIGGAQAIAAMAYGTRTIPKVEKIFGPGNAYVTTAKQIVSQDPWGATIDMPAGPSEVMVIAAKTARADWVAADLLAQAEHDVSSQALLVTTDKDFAERVRIEIQQQLVLMPRRSIAMKSIAQSKIVIVSNMSVALNVANLYAPEHLIIHTKDAEKYLSKISNAGSVFLGEWTPESAGDYASGTNHVLPTNGHARVYSGLSIFSFMKSMTAQHITRKGLQALGTTIVTMAEAEGLDAHAYAVRIRLRGKK